MIKVKNTINLNNTLAVRGKLVLLKDKMSLPKELDIVKEYASDVIKPIIISESEEIEDRTKCLTYHKITKRPLIEDYYAEDVDFYVHKPHKILALPEHFSPELLHDISNGKYKDNDEVYIECESKEFSWSGIYENFIKLNNNHITLVNRDTEEIIKLKNLMSKYTKEELGQITKFWDDYSKKNPEAYKALANDRDYSKEERFYSREELLLVSKAYNNYMKDSFTDEDTYVIELLQKQDFELLDKFFKRIS